MITVHAEAGHAPPPHAPGDQGARGKKAGVSLNPATSEDTLLDYVMSVVDLVLVMSVNPGFGGQSFLPEVLPKLARLRQMIDAEGREIDLEVDGGIKVGTARAVCEAGADALVAGNAIFAGGDYARAITAIRDDARGVTRTGAEA
jgi:ribulose-phosphate 3-epimerase